ncbi:MAG: DNA-binding response regulator [Sneathiella sp.]|nr:MAG: DNA-binding response regulator [Sneathiella sp.]
MKSLIYLLEDELDVSVVFERELLYQGFDVTTAGTLYAFTQLIKRQVPDLCIIDLSLPDGDGLSLLSETLQGLSIPTIIVSGRGALGDKIRGLDLGADDYLVKPVDSLELTARVRNMLKRRSKSKSNDNTMNYCFSDWTVDFSTFELTSPKGTSETLSVADANLLRAFIEAPGKVLSRDILLERCELGDEDIFDRSIDTRISRLRRKLEDDPKYPRHIKTIYGAGYVFTAKVTSL